MNSKFTRITAIIAIGLIAACVAASPASAQDVFKGSFTLPQEARWGSVNLPAGDYTFTLKSAGLPAMITLYGPNGGCFIMSSSTDTKDMDKPSNLKIERHGFRSFIKELYLADLHLKLNYSVPSTPKDQELAMGPVSTQEVLIASAK